MTRTHRTTIGMTVAGIEGCDVPILVDYIVCKGSPQTREDPGEPPHVEIEEVRYAPEATVDWPAGADTRLELTEEQDERITEEIMDWLCGMNDQDPPDRDYGDD